MSLRKRSRARGFTVVEVMTALAVLGLGAAGVIAMQKATLIANTNARNLVTANGIAQAWMERMRVDALAWTEQGGIPNLTSTEWLTSVTASNQVWIALTQSLPGTGTTEPAGSQYADVMGADIFPSDTSAPGYCTMIRLTRFATSNSPATTPLWSYYRMIRVEIRVFWDKSGRALSGTTACPQQLPSDYQLGRFGSVYLVSAVLENNSPI
jgi:prepilin-type N-terminal cleavage/methylation domain-containing protein